MEVRSYRDLNVWHMGMDLVCLVYEIAVHFPKSEAFALTNQIQRAVVSVPSNIAEGHARDSRLEFLHFLSIGLGSLAEVETQLIIANRLKYVDSETVEPVLSKCGELGKMIRALQKALKAKGEAGCRKKGSDFSSP